MKNALQKDQYRVLIHGTLARNQLPPFHTQMMSVLKAFIGPFALGRDTAVQHTKSPLYRPPVHRSFIHGTTAIRYTKVPSNTAFPYTERQHKSAKGLAILASNCTKLRSKLYNSGFVVDGKERGGLA